MAKSYSTFSDMAASNFASISGPTKSTKTSGPDDGLRGGSSRATTSKGIMSFSSGGGDDGGGSKPTAKQVVSQQRVNPDAVKQGSRLISGGGLGSRPTAPDTEVLVAGDPRLDASGFNDMWFSNIQEETDSLSAQREQEEAAAETARLSILNDRDFPVDPRTNMPVAALMPTDPLTLASMEGSTRGPAPIATGLEVAEALRKDEEGRLLESPVPQPRPSLAPTRSLVPQPRPRAILEKSFPEFSLTGRQTDYRTVSVALANDLMRDLDISREQAAAIVGNLAVETGNFSSLQERNPLVAGSRGGYGYAQWTADRRVDFEDWANQRDFPVDSYEANYSYLLHELTTKTEPLQRIGINSVRDLRNVSDVDAATSSFMNDFLRPAPQYSHEDRRKERAREILGFLQEGETEAAEITPEAATGMGISTAPLEEYASLRIPAPTIVSEGERYLYEASNRVGGNVEGTITVYNLDGRERSIIDVSETTAREQADKLARRETRPIEHIVLHNTGGLYDYGPRHYLNSFNVERGPSAQYLIDRSGQIFLTFPEELRGNQVAGNQRGRNPNLYVTNSNSIGIEIEADPNNPPTPEQLEASTWLTDFLMQRHGANNVVAHPQANTGKEAGEGFNALNHWRASHSLAPVRANVSSTDRSALISGDEYGPIPAPTRGVDRDTRVRAVQSAVGTAVDGVVGRNTEAKMRDWLEENNIDIPIGISRNRLVDLVYRNIQD